MLGISWYSKWVVSIFLSSGSVVVGAICLFGYSVVVFFECLCKVAVP